MCLDLFIYYGFTAQVLKVCRTSGSTACLKLLHKCGGKRRKISMTGPEQPQTCSHPTNAQMLTGVCQAVRILSPCQFHVYVSIGTLESDLYQNQHHKTTQKAIL